VSTAAQEPVRVEHEGRVAVITIDHPPANAVSLAVLAGIQRGLDEAIADDGCGAVVLTGAGSRLFSAGADLNEVASDGAALRRGGQALTRSIERAPIPIVAAVNGMALGGGCELALAADIRVAATTATFGQPEVKLGIIPGWGGTQRLPRLIGAASALSLLLEGEPVSAVRALEVGLVSRLVESDQLISEAVALAAGLAAQAPLAVAAIKRSVREGLEHSLAEGLDVEERELSAVLASEDAVEGVVAFLEKRPPRWTGR
jgi:enoyl-CoA hydratase/carnithine racemase